MNDKICGIFDELVFPSLQNVDDSKAFFKRKIEFLTKQIEKIQPVLQEKHAMKQGKPGLNSQNGLISSYIMKINLPSVNLQMVGCARTIHFALYRILKTVLTLTRDGIDYKCNQNHAKYLHITVFK